MVKRIACGVLAGLAAPWGAVPALADPVLMRAPMAAATLHQGMLDMVAYYLPAADGFEVVATFAPRGGGTPPARVIMVLADGDQTTFGIPGHPGSLFHFLRAGDSVSVELIAVKAISVAAR